MVAINVRSNIKDISKKLTGFAHKQVPFATAAALTSLAKLVKQGEVDALKVTLKSPSPFTLNSIKVAAARKNNLTASVYVMKIAAEYLSPYEIGGLHKLNSKALLNPKDIPLNQYGQLSRAVLAKLKSRPDIFIGPVKTSKGMINGVWQRPTDVKRVTLLNAKGKRLRGLNKSVAGKDGKQRGHLKLLIRFGDALPVKQRWNYNDRAKKIIGANFNKEFSKALAIAMATAR